MPPSPKSISEALKARQSHIASLGGKATAARKANARVLFTPATGQEAVRRRWDRARAADMKARLAETLTRASHMGVREDGSAKPSSGGTQ